MEHNAINKCPPANNSACGNNSTNGKAFLWRNKTTFGNGSRPFVNFLLTNSRHSARNVVGFGIYPQNVVMN